MKSTRTAIERQLLQRLERLLSAATLLNPRELKRECRLSARLLDRLDPIPRRRRKSLAARVTSVTSVTSLPLSETQNQNVS